MQPLRTKDWDRALVEYTAAMLLHEESKTKPSLTQRLHEISCPGEDTNPIYIPTSFPNLGPVFVRKYLIKKGYKWRR